METQDTILRLIQQTALILRAFFNQVPPHDKNEQVVQDFPSNFKKQTSVDLDVLLTLSTPQQVNNFFTLHPSFDVSNQEELADLLVNLAEQTTVIHTSIAYKKTALLLYITINQITQTHDWTRQNKINQLKVKD
ncbi:hypothetical protein HX004_02495 [Myroides sp. 1354]|uniref:hypothetical protein n=1 Tax=unclassified Myroides TaxID=2642485 RepID=UPI00257646EF|nr:MULTISPECIES: hypothetical protein [unclassified Myroides]MDM1043292.1 hypothetical protein [Myroides sp. R163-1]MDM1054655.1 hypothetical protein [Myroides sp. 1354]MDM1067952.1 hypothetical protein [Myroides sp. 1372]